MAKYGQEVADKKRPSSFTFEIWDFMQNAKRSCKTEASDHVDYFKILLSIGDATQGANAECDADVNGSTDGGGCNKDDDPNEPATVFSDEDDSFQWYESKRHWYFSFFLLTRFRIYCRHKPTQNMCEVELRDESSSENTPVQPAMQHTIDRAGELLKAKRLRLGPQIDVNAFDENIPALSINNVATTLNTLNLLKNEGMNLLTNTQTNNSFNNNFNSHKNDGSTNNSNNDHIKLLIEMQAREHTLRMEILRAQLETAKFNRDIAEINKVILLKQLTDSSRLHESDNEDHVNDD